MATTTRGTRGVPAQAEHMIAADRSIRRHGKDDLALDVAALGAFVGLGRIREGVGAVHGLAGDCPPRQALTQWLEEFVVGAGRYRGLPESIMATLRDDTSPLHASCLGMRRSPAPCWNEPNTPVRYGPTSPRSICSRWPARSAGSPSRTRR
jgi:hypothetical protein